MKNNQLSGLDMLQQIIKGNLPAPPMAETIPMKLTRAEKGKILFSARADTNHLNPLGTVHGGFAATVLDSATACAVHSMLEPGDGYATLELNVKMLKPVPVDVDLTAEATIIHCSRKIGVSEASLTDSQGRLYGHATATCMIFRDPKDPKDPK